MSRLMGWIGRERALVLLAVPVLTLPLLFALSGADEASSGDGKDAPAAPAPEGAVDARDQYRPMTFTEREIAEAVEREIASGPPRDEAERAERRRAMEIMGVDPAVVDGGAAALRASPTKEVAPRVLGDDGTVAAPGLTTTTIIDRGDPPVAAVDGAVVTPAPPALVSESRAPVVAAILGGGVAALALVVVSRRVRTAGGRR